MDIANLAAVAISANVSLTRQEVAVAAVKQSMDNHTQAAVQLTQQVTEQAKSASQSAAATTVDIVI